MPRHVQPVIVLSFTAEAAITKNRCVKFGTTDKECDVAGLNEEVMGVALNSAAIGEQVDVCVFGFCLVEASAAIAQGLHVAAAAAGKIAGITLGNTTADARVLGRLWDAAAADGEFRSVFVNTSSIHVLV